MHRWAFGWDALVAIGTLALAGVTYVLARATRRLARETAEEVRGQTRPVVVPVHDTVDVSPKRNDSVGSYFEVTVRLRNIGAGPALTSM
ncbi:MAG: hypothetical protein M3P18_26875 [Actinomycetota bacterium]|nr:hypothetical protein [Actinomycetota bacterium]